MNQSIVKVSALVHYLKEKLDHDSLLQRILIQGEISNFVFHRSGHWYFTLKDENASIRCVMFASSNCRVKFLPKNGDKVIVQADVTVYESAGQMQLLVTGMREDGLGELFLKFEALKKKLSEEGLFDDSHKKQIPKYPMQICLVTGKNTAARSDVLTTLARRWPVAKIIEYPVLVQGEGSAGEMIAALRKADCEGYDVILLVRGGGSIEDLWSFNDETLARTIYELKTPIITGVGHEVDYTIADFVADLRAPTPTGAAERCSPDIQDVSRQLQSVRNQLIRDMQNVLAADRQTCDRMAMLPVFTSPQRFYAEKVQRLNYLNERVMATGNVVQQQRSAYERIANQLYLQVKTTAKSLQSEIDQYRSQLLMQAQNAADHQQRRMQNSRVILQQQIGQIPIKKREELTREIHLLEAYSPLKSLARGYSVVTKNNHAITDVSTLTAGDTVQIRFCQGRAEAEIRKTEGDSQNGKGKENI